MKVHLIIPLSWYEKVSMFNFAALSFLYIALIPKGFGMPFAPKYIFMLIGVLLFILHPQKQRVYQAIAALDFILFFIFLMLAVYLFSGNYLGMLKFTEGLFYLIAAAVAVNNDVKKAKLATEIIAGIFVLSAFWFLGSLWLGGPFLTWHRWFYASNFMEIDYSNALQLEVFRPTGFVFNHFTFGYQMSAGVVLVGLITLLRRGKVLSIVFILTLIAAIYSGQRSVVVAVLISFVLFLMSLNHKMMLKNTTLMIIFLVFSLTIISSMSMIDKFSPWKTVYAKAIDKKDDARDRLSWQIATVKTIMNNPLGTVYSNVAWVDALRTAGASYNSYGGKVFYIHNGYLMYMLRYGWILVIITMGMLLSIGRKIIWVTRNASVEGGKYAVAVAFATLAVFIQAMFHNSSVYSNEPSTWSMLVMLCIWVVCLRAEKRKSQENTLLKGCQGNG